MSQSSGNVGAPARTWTHARAAIVRSVVIEPFPEGGLREIEARGTLKANMPVTHRLRIVFDDAGDDGVQPASVFLIGKTAEGFRIALIVQAKRAGDD